MRKIPPTFESRVVLDGSQTPGATPTIGAQFESRVVLDGISKAAIPLGTAAYLTIYTLIK